jgi:curved DNA-binding protein CbpA
MAIKDYYSLLGVTHDATLMDIEEAYAKTREKARMDRNIDFEPVLKAYETLKDPNLKRKYDSDLADGLLSKYHPEAKPTKTEPERFDFTKRKEKRIMANPAIGISLLLGLLVVMAAILYWQFGSLIFSPTHADGTELVNRHSRATFGTVVDYHSSHQFPKGTTMAAYQIRLASGNVVWMRKDEINRICAKASK